jgi:transcription elongation GreA/GreB family factor
MMGKKVGDVVEFDHGGRSGQYRIVELHNELLEDAAQRA